MKELVRVETDAFAFSNTPLLHYSNASSLQYSKISYRTVHVKKTYKTGTENRRASILSSKPP
jgi:hypothetical protein